MAAKKTAKTTTKKTSKRTTKKASKKKTAKKAEALATPPDYPTAIAALVRIAEAGLEDEAIAVAEALRLNLFFPQLLHRLGGVQHDARTRVRVDFEAE